MGGTSATSLWIMMAHNLAELRNILTTMEAQILTENSPGLCALTPLLG
jgi:hypothetical protein